MKDGNKVKFGLCNVHIAKMIIGEDGAITFGTPFKIPGAVSLSLDAEGDSEPFYADNMKFWESFANNGYSGDLEVAKLPEEFETEILGQRKDANGAIIENVNDKISPFAFMYQVEGDQTGTRFCYYNTTVSRPSTEANTTEDTKTPNTDTLSITTSARTDTGDVRTKLPYSEENKEIYEKFFEKVYEPTEIPSV
mgnify:FL=1